MDRLLRAYPSLSHLSSKLAEDLEAEIRSAELAALRHAESVVQANMEYEKYGNTPRSPLEALSDCLRDIRHIIGGIKVHLPGF